MFIVIDDFILQKSQIMKVHKCSWALCIYIYSIHGHCTEIKVNSTEELNEKFKEIQKILKEGN